ncbi:MAG: hypothetical protein ACOX6T_22670 [Myxococcales bacterium]
MKGAAVRKVPVKEGAVKEEAVKGEAERKRQSKECRRGKADETADGPKER